MRRLILALCLGCGTAAFAQDQTRPVPERSLTAVEKKSGIAARVNDEIITWDELNAQLAKNFPTKEQITDAMRQDHLRHVAEERLFQQEARKHKITVTEDQIDQQIKRVIKTLGDEEKYEEWLRWMKLTKAEHREQVRKEILEVQLYRYLIQKSWTNPNEAPLLVEFISPEEIRAAYEEASKRGQHKAIRQVSVGRIALQFNPGDSKDKEFKRRLAESVLRKLEVGSDFYILAFFYSDVRPVDKDKGRSYIIPDLKPDDSFFAPETMHYLFSILEVGKHSGIIEEGNTLNIFQLEKRMDKKEETFEEAQVQIRVALEHRKREANRTQLRAHILKNAYVWPKDLFNKD